MTGKKTNGKAKRERGAGSIIERPGTDKLYIRFYGRDGKQIQRATGTNDRAEAQRQLIDAMADEGRGETVSGGLKYEDLRRHYLRLKPEQERLSGPSALGLFFQRQAGRGYRHRLSPAISLNSDATRTKFQTPPFAEIWFACVRFLTPPARPK